MLQRTSAFADLRTKNRQAIGNSVLQNGVDLTFVVMTYASQIVPVSRNRFEVEVPDSIIESAWLKDWEASYDIAWQQYQTYVYAVRAARNPAWIAVTGYYAAFFSVRAFMFSIGVGHRSLPKTISMRGGLYEITLSSVKPAVGSSTLICVPQGGGGSHKAMWRGLDLEIALLTQIGGLDKRSVDILSSVRSLIMGPPHVSSYRNAVNYSLEIAERPVTAWTTELRRITDSLELELAISRTLNGRPEHRIELLMLATLAWNRDLYRDYLGRATRPDLRRGRVRKKSISSEDSVVTEMLERWI